MINRGKTLLLVMLVAAAPLDTTLTIAVQGAALRETVLPSRDTVRGFNKPHLRL
jgi:hypothetical protein